MTKKLHTELSKTIEQQKAEIAAHLKSIAAKVKQYETHTDNWGVAGDLGHVLDELQDIDKFLGKGG